MIARRTAAQVMPPEFLQLAGHPVRWRLLRELARTDQRVHELSAALGLQQNAVSYHLGRLRAGGLVATHRSSADGRDSYYRLELTRCGQQLTAAGIALHPGLAPTAPFGPPPSSRRRATRAVRVLFLCTGNSARSQIAEALLHKAGGTGITAWSAGSHPKPLHAYAVRAMGQYGIDLSDARSKHLAEVSTQRFQFVITLCDKVRELSPVFPGHPETMHWSIPDPATPDGGGRARFPAFQHTAEDLNTRIGFLTHYVNAAG